MFGSAAKGGKMRPSTLWGSWVEFERNYSGVHLMEFCRNHAEVPVFAVVFYLAFVFYVPSLLERREGFSLKWAFAAWNVLLALFSVCGSIRTVPHLYHALTDKGFDYTVCEDPHNWYFDGPTGLWVALFIYSKIPELLDTFFLILQKKRVIFLGWFHHTTVMLYCWHAFHNCVAPGLWFATMNYSVHSVMYTYYFLMVFKPLRAFARAMAPFITAMQILQMAGGVSVTLRSAQLYFRGGPCAADPANFKLGLGMYGSYLVLFSLLFWDKYFGSGPLHAKAIKGIGAAGGGRRTAGQGGGAEKNPNLCGVELTKDGAGFFQPDEVDANNAPASSTERRSTKKRD